MNLQIVSNNKLNFVTNYNINSLSLQEPKSLDMFDINIFSLQDENIWRNEKDSQQQLNCSNDFISIRKMISNTNKAIIIIALPQNYEHKWYYYSRTYNRTSLLKDEISNLRFNLLKAIIPEEYINKFDLIYENSITQIKDKTFNSSFSFITDEKGLTKSNGGNKATTIRFDNLILTTLDLKSPNTTIDDFIKGIGLDKQKAEIPQWLIDYKCFDDEQQQELIDKSNQEIDELKAKIEQANIKLEENSKYKSILVTSGNELVSTVFEILETLLFCDLSLFKDEKREDFLIPKENITFVGEIKGVTSNVKYEHVTQVEVHRGKYLDKLKDENRKENTKTLLIINPIRNKPLAEREPINKEQIDLSKKMGSLIITTETLLKIFEQFQNGQVSSDKIISVFSARIGLLTMDAFYKDEEKVDNSVYQMKLKGED